MDHCDELKKRSAGEPFAQLLGMEPVEVAKGRASVRMKMAPELHNIFGMSHGGAIFSLIDEAFQLACNSHGTLAVALNVNITYVAAPQTGETLLATATENHLTRKTSSYWCEVREVAGEKLIATAQALSYRTGREIEIS
jgi:acyl-CoA thioesterase